MPKNPHADFSPVLDGYSGIGAFRFWCQTALPLTYDDSLSYYELLNKVVNYLNHTIEDLTTVESNTSALANAYDQLQKYVNDYFDDLDVEAELRNVLDAMAEDGTLDALLDPLVENQLPGVVDEKIDAVVAEQIDGAVAGQIDESVADQLPALVDAGIPGEVSDWLEENVDPVGSAVMVDSSLTISGAAADAKATGDELSDLKTQLISEGNASYSLAGGTGESWSTQEIILDNVVYELIIKAFTVRNSLTSGYVIATVFTYADSDDTTGKQILTISKATYTDEDINIKIDNTISTVYKIKIMLRPENNTTAQVILRNITTNNDVEKNTAVAKTAGILLPFFEYGNITFSSSAWGVYTDSTSRIRTPAGMEVDVNGGDVIYCDNSIEAFISCTSDNVKWTTRGWVNGAIVAPLTGKYAFMLRNSPESTIVNINDVSSKFVVFSGNMATVFYDTSNFVNIVGLEDSINRSYVNYSTGAEVITGSNIFTRKFFNPDFKKIKVFGTSADNVPAVIAFYSTTTAEAGSYMSGVRYDANSASGAWYSADVPAGCKMVTVTSRGDGSPAIILTSADVLSNKINQSYYVKPSFMVPSQPYIVKHGGDSVIAPENSIPLFELAGKSGYWGIETDVRLTSDNVLVCMHDSTIDRTTTGTGAVSALTYNELQNYTIDVGDYTEYTEEELKVPTFEEYLRICRRYGCIAIIEVYNIGYGSRLIDTIRKMGMEDSCVIISFTAVMGTNVRYWSKKIPFILLYATGTILSTADLDSLPLNSGVGVGAEANGDIATYTPEFIEYAHITGRYISAWTLAAEKIDKWAYSGADMITVYSKE